MEQRKIKCGACGNDVQVTALNRVDDHKSGSGWYCTLSGARPEAVVNGTRVLPKQ